MRVDYEGEFLSSSYYDRYFERADQWRYEARIRLHWLLQHCSPARLVEIGSGGGFFLEACRNAGIDAEGIEPSQDGARHTRELGLPVHHGLFENVEVDKTFDVACGFHVLEHVNEPRLFIEKARSLLTPNGLICLEVPNIESPSARRMGTKWPDLQLEHHLWHFSPKTLAILLKQQGFEPTVVTTLGPLRYLRPRNLLSRHGLSILRRRGDYVRVLARAI